MKKFQMLLAAALAAAVLSAPMAYAAPSPTEPDRPVDISDSDVPRTDVPVDIDDSGVPLGDVPVDIGDPGVPLGDVPVDIDDPDVPLSYVPAPQTGVSGPSGMEALTLAALAFAVSGALVLVKAGKQTGSVR